MLNQVFDLPIQVWGDGADIWFVGDEQEGSEGFDPKGAWSSFVEHDWKSSKNPYLVHVGDPSDWLRPTMRDRIGAVLIKDRSAKRQLDDIVRKHYDSVCERLAFAEGRIIGMHEGHHEYEFLSGMSSTTYLAEQLKTINMGWLAITRIVFNFYNSCRSAAYMVASSHGNASGKATSSVAKSMEASMEDVICDLKVQGHACRSANWVPHTYRMPKRQGPPGMTEIVCRHLLVGGFCKSYTDGWASHPVKDQKSNKWVGGRPKSSYAEQRNLSSQPQMWGVARFKFRRERKKILNMPGYTDKLFIDIETVNRGPAVEQGEW